MKEWNFGKLLGSFVFRVAKRKTLGGRGECLSQGLLEKSYQALKSTWAVILGMSLPEELMLVPDTGRLIGHTKWMLRQLNPGVVGLNSPYAGSQTTLAQPRPTAQGPHLSFVLRSPSPLCLSKCSVNGMLENAAEKNDATQKVSSSIKE